MANFNFEEFKSGKLATNGFGAKVKFICESRGKMLVEVTPKSFGLPYTEKFNLDGKKYKNTNSIEDLVF